MTDAYANRYGDWIQTFTQRRFYPLDPRPDDINVLDIAHALSHLCRFAGHTNRLYSVGEHSLHVADQVRQRGGNATMQLAALLHDAPEAYIVDLPRPIKHDPSMSAYRDAEVRIAVCVETRFNLPPYALEHPIVKEADNDMLLTERRDLLSSRPESDTDWSMAAGGTPITDLDLSSVTPSPQMIKARFLVKFSTLTEGVNP